MEWAIFAGACVLGTVQHFLYEPLGRPGWLGWLLPVSESPWEHFKLAFWPLGAAAALLGRMQGADLWAILCACCLAVSHAFCTMMGIYFFYRGALAVRKPLLWVDIGNYYLTMLAGWSMAKRMLTGHFGWVQGALAAAVLLAWTAVFLLPEQKQPRLPLFASPEAQRKSRKS